MRYLGNKRRLAALGVLVAAVGVTLLVVLPALGSTAYDPVLPASTSGVMPTDYPIGGQNGICGTLFPGFTGSEYDNNNPKTTAHGTIGPGITLSVATDLLNTGNPANGGGSWPAYGKDKYFSYTASGLAIVGVGVNGGSDTTKYDYRNDSHVPSGYVSGDGYLHAPAQSVDSSGNPTSLYSLSHLTFCYAPIVTITGNVYQDANQNGQNDDGSANALGGWTVNLYKGVTPGTAGGGALVTSATTQSDGSYTFNNVVADGNLRLCVVPGSDPPSPTTLWVQTQPLPSTGTLCNGTNELPKGYDFTPTTSQTVTRDFGNVGGYPCDNPGDGVATDDYTVGTCKNGQTYVFNTGTLGSGAPFVDYWVGDPSQASIPLIEKLTFPDPIVNGLPQYTKLFYADGGGFPVDLSNLLQMKSCQLDPRSGEFTLNSPYDTLAGSTSVLPANVTSCSISIKTYVDASGNGHLQAYVYALGDSIRSAG